MKKISLVVLSLSLSLVAQIVAAQQYEKGFKCQLSVFGEAKVYIDQQFKIPAVNKESHGGDPIKFVNDGVEIEVLATEKWLGIGWWKNGDKVGEAVNIITEVLADSRVLLLFNPYDNDEQAHLNCDKL